MNMYVLTALPDLPGFSQSVGRLSVLCGLSRELIGWRISRLSPLEHDLKLGVVLSSGVG
ncbi:hypothetical protein [Chloroflexus sp. Y-396-1]|uniref:hypothetical protein n=1 Tax=Chloroflexus sp. Y-396-1 TaxID=867845 RepID=UPI0004AEC08B|nr:hypothetical protein [Chloroflexus sp. Y-396-1]